MFIFGLIVGSLIVGAAWYFWPKVKAAEQTVEDKIKAVKAAVKK